MSLLNAEKYGTVDGGPTFALGHRALRALWNVSWLLLASWTPRQLHAWRRMLLRLFGAAVAPGADVRGSARVWYPPNLRLGPKALIGPDVNCYNMAEIIIGEGALISQGAFLCGGTHNFNDPHFQLIARPIQIGAGAWIAADAFVGPGVNVGASAVLGARAVTARDLLPWTVYAGNPARVVGKRTRR